MAAAYAALVSLLHIVEQIEHHPRPPISLDKQQVESLSENGTFLQEFLESYPHFGHSREADGLERRIADAAHAAEDIIESHIVDQVLAAGSTGDHREEISSNIDFYEGLQKVIEDMDSIKTEVIEIEEKMGIQDHSSIPAGSSRSASAGHNITMVGFDDVLIQVMDMLTREQPDRRIIPIVGMGGIGKTTLARNIYQNQVVVQRFDILVWVTISQEYKMREILLELLQHGREYLSEKNEYELGDKLRKTLSSRRYLIIMDDIWDIEVWDQLKFFFPDNNNGSRIMLTTRLSNLASHVADSCGCIDMAFLDDDNGWELFSKIVFGEEVCPRGLEEIGKKIVKDCKGLPLSIVVIGGLLAKSKRTREYWEYIEENLNSVANSENSESCLNILQMSYNELPIYLKPCFLYIGVKDYRAIRVSTLTKLWVAEGFLKPISGKSLEVIAKGYLKELIDRNLIVVLKLGSTGNIKFCNIHDILRDLCLREAHKGGFYYVIGKSNPNLPQGIITQRRIFLPRATLIKVLETSQSRLLARSLTCFIEGVSSCNCRLLRILEVSDVSYSLEDMFQLVNLRYLAVGVHLNSKFPSSVCLLWNIQTLIVDNGHCLTAPAEIWNMPQLRHVKFRTLCLPNPPCHNGGDDTVLENLQSLMKITNFKYCGEEVVKRMPNIKKLRILFDTLDGGSPYCLNSLDRLHKLESFGCYSRPLGFNRPSGTDFLQNLTFPHSLKRLSFAAIHVSWEDILENVGSLPLLEKLKLIWGSFKSCKWETVEGQFRSLKFLLVSYCSGLEHWITESSHFPRLEQLHLGYLNELKEIPLAIGEIPTLQSIDLRFCSDSVAISAKNILEELGDDGFQVRVRIFGKNETVENLASPNFKVLH